MSQKIAAVIIALFVGLCVSSRRLREVRADLEEQVQKADGLELLAEDASGKAPVRERKAMRTRKPPKESHQHSWTRKPSKEGQEVLAKIRGQWAIEDEVSPSESKNPKCCKNHCCFDEQRANDGYLQDVCFCSNAAGCPKDVHKVEDEVCNSADRIKPGSVSCDTMAMKHRPFLGNHSTSPKAELETKPMAESATEPQAESETEPEAESKPEPQAESATEPMAESEAEPQAESTPPEATPGECCKKGRVCCSNLKALFNRHFCSDSKDCRAEGLVITRNQGGSPDDLVCSYINSITPNLVKCDQ